MYRYVYRYRALQQKLPLLQEQITELEKNTRFLMKDDVRKKNIMNEGLQLAPMTVFSNNPSSTRGNS